MYMRGHSLENDGDILSFLDAGGDGKPLLALHGHWMGASDFAGVAEDLSPEWRVIALDQRGFGETDHGAAHSIAAYIGDVVALLDRGLDRGLSHIFRIPSGAWKGAGRLTSIRPNFWNRNRRRMVITGTFGCKAAAPLWLCLAAKAVCDVTELRAMAAKREFTTFAQLNAGHSVHIDAHPEFAELLRQFLQEQHL